MLPLLLVVGEDDFVDVLNGVTECEIEAVKLGDEVAVLDEVCENVEVLELTSEKSSELYFANSKGNLMAFVKKLMYLCDGEFNIDGEKLGDEEDVLDGVGENVEVLDGVEEPEIVGEFDCDDDDVAVGVFEKVSQAI